MSEDTRTEKRTTAAEIKKQIDAAQKEDNANRKKSELVQSGLPMNVVADRINAISTTQEAPSASKSQPAQAPAEPAIEKETAESVELKEWAKKKGIDWETSDDVLLGLRKKDQEFHRKQAERKKETSQQPPAYIPPPQPNYAPVPPAPAYAPPRQVVENLARQYNMTVEDFERITLLQRDFTAAALAQERQRHEKELEDIRRENIKNSEFRELSADPVFRKQEVALRFHNVLERMQEENPDSFSQDPYAYRKAYDQALRDYARESLERSDVPEANAFQLPRTPPKPTTSSGTGRATNENSLTQSEFNRLSVDEQRAYLDKLNLVMPKY